LPFGPTDLIVPKSSDANVAQAGNPNMSDIVEKKIAALHAKKREVLGLPPQKALDTILAAEHPAALVHAFTEQDFHLLMHDIGVDDARPLLALAKDRQLEYIVDTEIWSGDQIDFLETIRWLETLYRADPDRTIRWLMTEKLEFLELFLFWNIQVIIREHDQDSGALPESYFSYDDTVYINIPDYPHPEGPDADDEKLRKQLVRDLLNRMAATDYPLYRNIVLEAARVIPAESTEEEYRLRNVRLAEKGFLPWAEAIGIYQPITADQLFRQRPKLSASDKGPGRLPVPLLSSAYLDTDTLFGRALQTVADPEVVMQLQAEFATMCNQIIVADKEPIREKPQLAQKVKKACATISLGLEHLLADTDENVFARAGALISKYRLAEIFRVGYGLGLNLKWQARKWQADSWANRSGLPLNFWGEAWLGVLGGLLLEHPRYYDNYAKGVLYRDFESLVEVEGTRSVLAAIMAFDDLLAAMNIDLQPLDTYGYVGHYSLVLTLWARHLLDLSGSVAPLTIDQIRQFFDQLWDQKQRPYKITNSRKEAFLAWIADTAGRSEHDVSTVLAPSFESLFNTLEEEYANVAPQALELKYVQGFFLLEPEAG
jgi:hypothetical protein